MKKSLFRFTDRFELFGFYALCFGLNILFDHSKKIEIESDLLQSFLKQFYDHQDWIMLLLSFIVAINHYQMLKRKKTEIYCRVLVGDTIFSATFRYIAECLVILGMAVAIAMIISAVAEICVINNIYLSFVFLLYILISSRMVSKLENI
ncbi:MAG: hypothetical protein K6F93_01475 [Lachnospiraceae bacterium]|nr:hypothetical protein [Lachnospiraceae bacterium]